MLCLKVKLQERKSQYTNKYCLTLTGLCHRKHQKLFTYQVVSQRLHSYATYEYSYQIGVRNDRL